MALIKCPDCSKDVSDIAPSCPHCGRPIAISSPISVTRQEGPLRQQGIKEQKRRNGCLTVLLVLFGLGLLGSLIEHCDRARSTRNPRSPASTARTKGTGHDDTGENTANTLIEKRKGLLKRCQEAIKAISKMQSQQQGQMAALASEADGGLKASGRILSGAIKVPNPNAPKQMLDDVEFFVDEITRCSEAAKQGKPCSLSIDAQAVLRSFTESDKAKALMSLSIFCNE